MCFVMNDVGNTLTIVVTLSQIYKETESSSFR